MESCFKRAMTVFAFVLLTACGGSETATSLVTDTRLAAATVVGDQAAFTGNRANYTIVKSASGYTVIDGTGVDGTTNLANSIQRLKFGDVTVNLTVSAEAQAINSGELKRLIELYIAFFNRVPEADGLAYWIGRYRAGERIDQISESFYSAAVQYPNLTGYSVTMTPSEFVRLIYRNVLGRSGTTAPPDEDVQYWAGQLASGAATKGTLVQAMLDSAHTFNGHLTWGWVPALLDNKYTVGHYFAVQQGLSYNTPETSIARTMEIASAVTPQGIDEAVRKIPVTSGTPPVDPATPEPAPPASTPPGTAAGGTPPAPPAQAPFSAAVTAAPADGATIADIVRLEVRGSNIENAELLPAGGYTPIYAVFNISGDKSFAWVDLDPRTLPRGPSSFRIGAWNAPARSSSAQEITAMPTRTWTVGAQPVTPFAAELMQAPADGATLTGVITLEVRGSGIANVELLPASGYAPTLGRFIVSSDKTYARLDFDTRVVPNNLLQVRISAFDVPAGNMGAREIVVMPARGWFLRNIPPPYGTPEGRAARCLSSGHAYTRLSDPWPVVCIEGTPAIPYEQCKDGFGMLYANPEDGLPVLRDGRRISKLYCEPGANNGVLNLGCSCTD